MPENNNDIPTPSGEEGSSLPTPIEQPSDSSEEGLVPPSHEEEKVQVISPDDDNDSIVPVPLTKQVIKVVATRKGFYGQERIPAGREFSVSSFKALGEWMKCLDPEMEKKRIQFFKDKKAKK